ncbi:MAG: hypothetical protein H0T73_06735, partial [Ardenticatenales bacterium]|nr:hypothetical protein [Ardenticatenales bacterium]
MITRAPFLTPVTSPHYGTLTVWQVGIGQHVTAHATIGTMLVRDTTEVPIISPYSGLVAKILRVPGEELRWGMSLLLLADARDDQGRDASNTEPFKDHFLRWMCGHGRHTPQSIAIHLGV